MVSGYLLAHDDYLVPFRTIGFTDGGLQVGCRIDEGITIAPDEINLAELAHQRLVARVSFQCASNEVRRLIIKPVGHMEIGLGNRVGLIEIDGRLAAERVLQRVEAAGLCLRLVGSLGLHLYRLFGSRRFRGPVHRRPQDSRILLDDDEGLFGNRRAQAFGRFDIVIALVHRLPGIGLIFPTATAHEPEQRSADEHHNADNDHPPLGQESEHAIDKRRLCALRRRADDRGRRRRFCDRFGSFGGLGGRVFARLFRHDAGILIRRYLVCRRYILFTANTGQFLTQRGEFVIANLDEGLLLRHVCRLEVGNTLQDLFLARYRLLGLLGVRLGVIVGVDGRRLLIDVILVGRHEGQARARLGRRRDRAAAPCGMLALCLGERIAAADAENVIGTRNAYRRAGAENVDIPPESIGIRLEDGQHGLVHRQATIGPDPRCDPPESLAALDDVIATGGRVKRRNVGNGRRLRFRLRLRFRARLRLFGRQLRGRCRGRPRRRRRPRLRLRRRRRGPLDLAAVCRCASTGRLHGLCHAARRRRVSGRVQQERVFAQQGAPRPYCLDKERQERLAHCRLGPQLHDIAVRAPSANDRKGDVLQIERTIQSIPRERSR